MTALGDKLDKFKFKVLLWSASAISEKETPCKFYKRTTDTGRADTKLHESTAESRRHYGSARPSNQHFCTHHSNLAAMALLEVASLNPIVAATFPRGEMQ